MTRWSLFLQTLSLLHHFLGLYCGQADPAITYTMGLQGDLQAAQPHLEDGSVNRKPWWNQKYQLRETFRQSWITLSVPCMLRPVPFAFGVLHT